MRPACEFEALIHGMLNPWQLWEEAAEHFSKECYVIVPELDAHTEEETISIGIKYLDSVLCSYPFESKDVIDR